MDFRPLSEASCNERLRPLLGLTLLPGFSAVPLAERIMFLTDLASIAIAAGRLAAIIARA